MQPSQPPPSIHLCPAPIDSPSNRTNNIYIECQEITGRAFSDQTGKFVCTSSSGNKYIFILYDYDSNSIHAQAIPSRTKGSLKKAYKTIVDDLTRRGFKPCLQTLDNEISDIMKEYMTDEDIAFQLTPVGLHRRNLAERAIQTFKAHFIAGLCSTHPDFPLVLWDKLLAQCLLTLNLLRTSRVNPQLSAYAQLYGFFDYTKTPLVPPGMKCIVHEDSQKRGTYAPHGLDAWYIGPALNHYRCHRVWVTSTCSERITDSVTWLPHGISVPTTSPTDLIIAATNDLTTAIAKADLLTLLPPDGTETRKVLEQLTALFHNRPNTIKQKDKHLPSSAPTNARVPRVRWADQLATDKPTPPIATPLPRVTAQKPLPPPTSARVRMALPTEATTTKDYHNLSTIRTLARKAKRTPAQPAPHKTALPVQASLATGQRRSSRTPRPNPKYLAVNAVLDPTTGRMLEYKDLLKGLD